jgi:hypothetical protein
MVFECPRCKYSSNKKCNLINHLKKKLTCEPIHSNISIEDILESLKKIEKAHVCSQCDKSFSHASSLSRHAQTVHITNNAIGNSSIGNNSNHNTINNTINNNYTINPVINIELNPWGSERMDYILEDMELLTKCLQNAIREGLLTMFKEIHMNQEILENQNIKFQRENYPKQVKIYKQDGDKLDWIIEEAGPILESSIKKMVNILMIHNHKLFVGIENPTTDDTELYEYREKNLMDIKSKIRGLFSPIRNNILTTLKEHAKKLKAEQNLSVK